MVLHSLFRKISHKPPYQQLLIIQPQLDDNCPKAEGSPPTPCKPAASPCFSASKLGRRVAQEQTPINQNENSATTSCYPLLIETPDLPTHQVKIQEVFLLPRKQLLHFNAMIIFSCKIIHH